jgi:hypothetical protein
MDLSHPNDWESVPFATVEIRRRMSGIPVPFFDPWKWNTRTHPVSLGLVMESNFLTGNLLHGPPVALVVCE